MNVLHPSQHLGIEICNDVSDGGVRLGDERESSIGIAFGRYDE